MKNPYSSPGHINKTSTKNTRREIHLGLGVLFLISPAMILSVFFLDMLVYYGGGINMRSLKHCFMPEFSDNINLNIWGMLNLLISMLSPLLLLLTSFIFIFLKIVLYRIIYISAFLTLVSVKFIVSVQPWGNEIISYIFYILPALFAVTLIILFMFSSEIRGFSRSKLQK